MPSSWPRPGATTVRHGRRYGPWAHPDPAVRRGRQACGVALVMRTDQVFRWRLADYDLMADAYEMLAADYDWLFDDDALADGGAVSQPAAARIS